MNKSKLREVEIEAMSYFNRGYREGYEDGSEWGRKEGWEDAMKQCNRYGIMFLRPDDTPIPDDACTGFHEEVEALVRKGSVKEGIKKRKACWVMNGLTWDSFKRTIRGE